MKTKEETVQLMNQGVKSNYHVINKHRKCNSYENTL